MDKTIFKDIAFWIVMRLVKAVISSDLFQEVYEKIETLDFKSITSEEKRQEVYDWLREKRRDLSGNWLNFVIESVLSYIRYHRDNTTDPYLQ